MENPEMYMGLYKIKSNLGNHVIANVRSNLPADYPELFQAYLDTGKHPDTPHYDPHFPWESANLTVLYMGLKPEADEWTFSLPDGRVARVFNINPGSQNQMAKVFDGYARAIDAARTALLTGATPAEAAQKLWAYCDEYNVVPSLTNHTEKFANIVKEMEEYQMILSDDSAL